MSTYFIGDIHGCFTELKAVLTQASFNPELDQLWLTGDLVSRGPHSLEVLRFVRSLGPAVRMVLGNHDLHLIAINSGISPYKPKECLGALLDAKDSRELINWLHCQPVLQVDEQLKIVMVHAGITPQWDLKTAKICAREVEKALRGNNSQQLLLNSMYEDAPHKWKPRMNRSERLRFSLNALTRIRYCFPDGQLNMMHKGIPGTSLEPLKPWFDFPRLVDSSYTLIFGHWASLLGKNTPAGIIGLDTGCCWGGELTMLRWEDRRYFTQPASSS